MSGGLLALLDDVAAIAKVAAASLDDVAAQTMKAGSKAAGIVIDDAAADPKHGKHANDAEQLEKGRHSAYEPTAKGAQQPCPAFRQMHAKIVSLHDQCHSAINPNCYSHANGGQYG